MNTTKTTSKPIKMFSGDRSKNDNNDDNDKAIANDTDTGCWMIGVGLVFR